MGWADSRTLCSRQARSARYAVVPCGRHDKRSELLSERDHGSAVAAGGCDAVY